ncbi:hypothetical protein HDV00_004943 [Rhizophlyctis rosea]|nr:hypothetical protein HDV00_004943 [Rhizophlyctis rosea]
MAAVETLPDILLLLFAHPSLSVPDLLTCAGQHQIWRQKLVEAFPEGCLPVLYEREIWRDLATLWWAWRRPWTPGQTVAETTLEEVEVGDVLPRKVGVVRDLTAVRDFGSMRGGAKGGRWDGQIVIAGIAVWPTKNSIKPKIDVVFEETPTTVRPVQNISRRCIFQRTDIITSLSVERQQHEITAQDWDTGKVLARIPVKSSFDCNICGHYMWERNEKEVRFFSLDGNFANSTSIQPFQPRFHERCAPLHAFNETVFAWVSPAPASGLFSHLNIARLLVRKTVASFRLSPWSHSKGLELTRLNVFLKFSDGDCWVFDLKLNPLYTCAEFAPARIFDWMAVGGVGKNDMYNWDPKTQTRKDCKVPKRLVSTGLRNGDWESISVRGMAEWTNKGSYFFSVIEYPVDDTGRRTGAGGTSCYYWRWLE